MTSEGIVLASASPRRAELLSLAGISFKACAPDVPEEHVPGETPEEFALRLSETKARAGAKIAEGRIFIGADTIVVLGETILGKPVDRDDAVRMLELLSGKTHRVITAFTMYDKSRDACFSKTVATHVLFKRLSLPEIERYVASGCPMDKAGAYAIQGGAAHMVQSISGSYTNVVGLPMCELYGALEELSALKT